MWPTGSSRPLDPAGRAWLAKNGLKKNHSNRNVSVTECARLSRVSLSLIDGPMMITNTLKIQRQNQWSRTPSFVRFSSRISHPISVCWRWIHRRDFNLLLCWKLKSRLVRASVVGWREKASRGAKDSPCYFFPNLKRSRKFLFSNTPGPNLKMNEWNSSHRAAACSLTGNFVPAPW